jgi:cysteine desulfurase
MQSYIPNLSVRRIYLDNNATTFPAKNLIARWSELIDICGNPSSVHADGRLPKQIIRECRNKLALHLNCSAHELLFNSGASEGNASVLKSVFNLLQNERNEFLISAVEHPSVLKTARFLESKGAHIKIIPVDRNGKINIDFIKSEISQKTALVSCMFANNETGVIFPIKEICQIAHEHGALMHSDCVQVMGKAFLNIKDVNLDYATFSGHKFYSLKGVGFCYVKTQAPWESLIFGSQERARRGGTENVTGIASMNIVLDEFHDLNSKISKMEKIRNNFENKIINKLSHIKITGYGCSRLPNTSNIMIEGIDGDTMLMSLDMKGISISTGSACSSGSPDPSPVLMAMGFNREEAQTSLRISIGWDSEEYELDSTIEAICEVVHKLRNLRQIEIENKFSATKSEENNS